MHHASKVGGLFLRAFAQRRREMGPPSVHQGLCTAKSRVSVLLFWFAQKLLRMLPEVKLMTSFEVVNG